MEVDWTLTPKLLLYPSQNLSSLLCTVQRAGPTCIHPSPEGDASSCADLLEGILTRADFLQELKTDEQK